MCLPLTIVLKSFSKIKYFERLSCGYFALKIYQNRSLKISFVKLSILNTCILDNVLKICFIWTLIKPMNKWVPNERTLNIILKMVSNFFCLEGEVIRLFTCDPFLDTFLCIICTCIQFILFPVVIIYNKTKSLSQNKNPILIHVWPLFHILV